MAIKDLLIKIGIKGDKKAEKGIGKVDKAFGGLAKSAMKIGAAFYSAKGIITGLTKIVEISGKMQAVGMGFDNLTKSAGMSSSALGKLQKATDGTVSSLDLMTQANNMLLLGITDSEDEMAEMFDIAQRLGSALGKDTLFGVESLVTGMGRQSKLMLDNLGIMVDVEKGNIAYAESIGKTVSQLTDAEKKQAFTTATMKAAKDLVSKLGEEQLTTADRVNVLKSSATNMAGALGDILTPAFDSSLEVMADFSTKISETVAVLAELDLKATGENILKNADALLTAFTEIFKSYIDFIPDFAKTAFDKIFPIVSSVFEKLVNGIKAIAGIIWEPIPILAQIMAIKVQNVFITMFNALKEQFNQFTDTWLGEKLGIEKITATDLIDTEGLEAQLGETGISALLNKFFTGEDNIQNLSQFTEKQKEIWATYFDSVAVLADESGVKTAGAIKVIGDATDKTTESVKKMTVEQAISAGQGAESMAGAARSVIKSYAAESVAGQIKGVLSTIPPPFSLVLAGAAAAAASQLFEQLIPKFAQGGVVPGTGNQDTVPAMLTPGEVILNKAQQENLAGGMGGITLNISAPLVDETVIDSIIPAIQKAQRMNLA
tara:strand:- start:218 stop:2026 length:1809 start_codon:yes stop_codon:yes gene_type:complete